MRTVRHSRINMAKLAPVVDEGKGPAGEATQAPPTRRRYDASGRRAAAGATHAAHPGVCPRTVRRGRLREHHGDGHRPTRRCLARHRLRLGRHQAHPLPGAGRGGPLRHRPAGRGRRPRPTPSACEPSPTLRPSFRDLRPCRDRAAGQASPRCSSSCARPRPGARARRAVAADHRSNGSPRRAPPRRRRRRRARPAPRPHPRRGRRRDLADQTVRKCCAASVFDRGSEPDRFSEWLRDTWCRLLLASP